MSHTRPWSTVEPSRISDRSIVLGGDFFGQAKRLVPRGSMRYAAPASRYRFVQSGGGFADSPCDSTRIVPEAADFFPRREATTVISGSVVRSVSSPFSGATVAAGMRG